MSEITSFTKCYRCFKPKRLCYCSSIQPIDSGIRFIFLMHPKEAYQQKTGTGRLTSLSLVNSEIIIGINFSENTRVQAICSGTGEFSDYYPVVLYPGERASRANSSEFAHTILGKKLLVIVIDATWFFAHKIIKSSTNLQLLPTISFAGSYRSRFDFKKQPSEECLSTIESCYYLLQELKENGIVDSKIHTEPLLTVLRKMVDFQLACEQQRHEALAAELYPELFQRQT